MTATADARPGHRWRLLLRRTLLWRMTGCVALTCGVLWPFVLALVAGWDRGTALLLRDMSVPGSMLLNDLATGADGVARAVPQDALLAALSPLVPPPVVVGVVVLGCGVAGAVGASLLARRFGAGWCGQALAAFLVLWNPYVAERLLQGHWSVVSAGTLLPLVALLALPFTPVVPVSPSGRRAFPGPRVVLLIVVMGLCALTPTGLILGTVTAVVASGWRRSTVVPVVTGAVLSLPWVVPSLVNASGAFADAAGADLFAARAEPGVGTPGALAGLGGIWNAEAVPAHRLPWAGVLLALVAVAVAVRLWRRGGWTGGIRRLSLLAAVAVVVPALLATGPGLAVLGGLMETVPGTGLLRDTQKFVVLAVPALAVLLGRVDVLVAVSVRRGTGGLSVKGVRNMPGTVSGMVSRALPLAAIFFAFLQVPALSVDLSEVRPVHLGTTYARVVSAVESAAQDAGLDRPRTLLWPPGNYRMIDGRPALDPLLKMLPGSPVDPGYLVVGGQVVDGDPEMLRLLSNLVSGPGSPAGSATGAGTGAGTGAEPGSGTTSGEDGLAEAGIDLVLVEEDATRDSGVGTPTVLTDAGSPHELLWSSDGWTLYRVR